MTDTDELRRLLDESGVVWGNVRNDGSESKYLTEWQFDGNQGRAVATEWAVGSGLSMEIRRYHLTPEQAIDATIGTGTCKLDGYTDAAFRVVQAPDETDFIGYAEVCECTACGASVIVPHEYERVSCERDELWPTYNYCPHCGAKVIAPTTNNVDVEVSDG